MRVTAAETGPLFVAVRFVGWHWMFGDYTVEVNQNWVHRSCCGGAANRHLVLIVREGTFADSDSEERPDLAEPFAAKAVVRSRLCDDCPVLGRVTAHAQVSELVGDYIIENRWRGHHGAPVEA